MSVQLSNYNPVITISDSNTHAILNALVKAGNFDALTRYINSHHNAKEIENMVRAYVTLVHTEQSLEDSSAGFGF